jgi:succinate--hydroxymethylglutarate CoA-transferase
MWQLLGYETTGLYSERGGNNLIAAAEGGLLHVAGERNGASVGRGLRMIDMATDYTFTAQILPALRAIKPDAGSKLMLPL